MSQHFQSAGEIVLQVTLKYLENENCTAPKQEQEGDESNNYSMLYDLVAIQSSKGLQGYHPKKKKKLQKFKCFFLVVLEKQFLPNQLLIFWSSTKLDVFNFRLMYACTADTHVCCLHVKCYSKQEWREGIHRLELTCAPEIKRMHTYLEMEKTATTILNTIHLAYLVLLGLSHH